MNAVRNRHMLFLAIMLTTVLAGCAGTQANTTQAPAQGTAAQPQPSTSVPF